MARTQRRSPIPCSSQWVVLCLPDYAETIFGERCADLPRCRTSRTYSLPPNPRWTASPICPDLIYDRHRSPVASPERPVCTENLIRVDDVMESPKLAG